jgi:hypothetical protein
VIDVYFMALEPRVALEGAEYVLVVVEHRNSHFNPLPSESATL